MSGEITRTLKVLFEFRVLYHEWELDGTGWIVEQDGWKRLVMSCHGREYFANASELVSKINE